MRIRAIFNGDEKTFDSSKSSIVVGRPNPETGVVVDLDLTPDMTVSRPHAYITFKDGKYWIEDPKSTRGTKIDDREIKGCGKVQLTDKNSIRIGETTLFIESPPAIENETISPVMQAMEPAALAIGALTIGPATSSGLQAIGLAIPFETPDSPAVRHERLLHELLIQVGTDASLDQLLQFAVERLVAAMPTAERGALLLKDATTGEWLLKAHCPDCEPAISATLAEHAVTCGGGFIWKRGKDLDISVSEIATGIYAPLTWRGDTFGVVCVDNFRSARQFDEEDLKLVVAAAQHVALVIANYRMRDDLRRNAALVERLLTNFSPSIRKKLLEKARLGRLRLGGEKSEVTILSSDIRGFTAKSANMDAADVVDMLNAYFSALVSEIFRHDGTVDKFIGDAILAVFGSPEPDPRHHINAVEAAMAMQAAIERINNVRRANNQVVCEIGIGIHCGEVLHGFIGSEERMEFTVIGDAVNRAAHYCDAAAPGKVLISPETYQRVFKYVSASRILIDTKHEGDLPAYCVEGIKLGTVSTLAPARMSRSANP